MDYTEAIEILSKILKEHTSRPKEREAIFTAINLLKSGVFAKDNLKRKIDKKKAKKEKDLKW